MKITFADAGWRDYLYWQLQNKKTLRKINRLIEDIKRNGYEGLGHPEPLRGDFAGWGSRAIDEKNRLVYRLISDEHVEIIQCRGHYSDT